jgi:hypothetical protein
VDGLGPERLHERDELVVRQLGLQGCEGLDLTLDLPDGRAVELELALQIAALVLRPLARPERAQTSLELVCGASRIDPHAPETRL